MISEELRERYPNVRNDLIAARRALGISQKEAAEMFNVSWQYYSMVELGLAVPYPRLAEWIEKKFGINVLEEA